MVKGENSKVNPHQDYGYNAHFYEKPIFQHIIILSIVFTLIVSIVTLANVMQIKKVAIPKTISTDDFLKKLTSHAEMKQYLGVAPLNIVEINSNNMANLQSQIAGLNSSYLGNFIIQYSDKVVIYDYNNNIIKATVNLQQQQPELPNDFFSRLNKHPELSGLGNQQPIGGQLDQASLSTLKQQFPEVYVNAKVGDFLLRYQTKLIIYDFNQDKIINAVSLG